MSRFFLFQTALALAAATLLTSCLVRQKVIQNGEVKKSSYIVKRPLKQALSESR